MKFSNLFFKNNFFDRDHSNFELIELMKKANFVHQDASGIYSWLSLGAMLKKKVEAIVCEEMENIGFSQIQLSIVQDAALWKKTNRYDTYGAELFKLKDRKDHEYCLAATCEEAVTAIVKDHYNRTQMNVHVYQIGNKYRDELRAKAGLMRAKEFTMKDGYSFCANEEDVTSMYVQVRAAYCRIFERLGLQYNIVSSDNGEIGGKSSEEFHCESMYGEESNGDKKFLEVAHIFNLGQEYSSKMELVNHVNEFVHMACYGIGISRIVMALLEKQRDSLGFYGTEKFHTFHTVIVAVDGHRFDAVKEKAQELYNHYKNQGVSVLLDDRSDSAGKKMSDSELIGVCQRIVVSRQALERGTLEILTRTNGVNTKNFIDMI